MSERLRSSNAEAGAKLPRVLLVDDHPVNRKLCTILLEHAGYQVIPASDGTEALALAAEGGVDIVLMDVHMPGMDGFETTQRLRALEGAVGQVPVIALSADCPHESVAAMKAAGMNGFLAKPIQVPELLSTLRANLPQR